MSFIMEISTKVGCGMNCSFCPQKLHVASYVARSDEFIMSMETYRACLAKIPKEVEIMFAGYAEPWLNEHCTDMLLLAHEAGHPVSVYTTCVGMKSTDVPRIKHLPYLHFVIHLPDDAEKMKVAVTSEYLETLQACIKLIPKTALMVIGKLHPKVEGVIKKKVGDGTKSLISRAGTVDGVKAPHKTGRLKRLQCMDHNVLIPNGDVHLCCCDYGLKENLGSLLELPSYMELFKGDGYQRILMALEDETMPLICRNCELAVQEKA